MIDIRFFHSNSRNYYLAIALASKFHSFSPSTVFEPNTITIEDSDILSSYDNLIQLFGLVQKWSHLRILHNGRPIEFGKLFCSLNNLHSCSSHFDANPEKEYHCGYDEITQGWGCRHLQRIFRHTNGTAHYKKKTYWYNYGRFIDENTWQVDRDAIHAVLKAEIEEKFIDCCPHFKIDNVYSRLNSMPAQIDLKSRFWQKFYREDIGMDGKPMKVPVNIRYINQETPYDTEKKLEVLLASWQAMEQGDLPDEILRILPKGIKQMNKNLPMN
jgi:hypothetical protein